MAFCRQIGQSLCSAIIHLGFNWEEEDDVADAFQIAIDAAEPKMELYEYFVEEGLKGKRTLIIQTVDNRRAVWREFTRENCELYGVLELVPLLDNPNQYVLPVVTRFEGRAAPER